MRTTKIKVFALIAIVGMAFMGCQKDDKVAPEKKDTDMLNKKVFMYKYKMKLKSRLKGINGDETNSLTDNLGVAYTFGKPSETYKTLRIDRPNGRYFYIMIENSRLKGYGARAYNDDESKVSKYGRLYNYNAANKLKRNVYMKLPVITEATGHEGRIGKVRGRLPNRKDIQHLLELEQPIDSITCTKPLNLEDNMYTEHWYIDAFLAGLEEVEDFSAADHSLGGQFNPNYKPSEGLVGPFSFLDMFGKFWLGGEGYSCPAYSVQGSFYIFKDIYTNVFEIYRGNHSEEICISVRYVFEPIYK